MELLENERGRKVLNIQDAKPVGQCEDLRWSRWGQGLRTFAPVDVERNTTERSLRLHQGVTPSLSWGATWRGDSCHFQLCSHRGSTALQAGLK